MSEAPAHSRPAARGGALWYDSLWLEEFERARGIVRQLAPLRLKEFEQSFNVFRTPPNFQVKFFEQVFDEATMQEVRRVTATLAPCQLELHEARDFKRFVVHDHPLFTALHRRVTDVVSNAVGEPVEASYNFLSLYGPQGVCPIHMDAPQAKWTLDLCINQSNPWPIHFSPIVPWPVPGAYGEDWDHQIRRSVGLHFTSYTLQPGQAVLFAGSSQWHYRDLMPGEGRERFCDLLFFHFIPRGTSELIEPANWARIFGIPELEY